MVVLAGSALHIDVLVVDILHIPLLSLKKGSSVLCNYRRVKNRKESR